MNVSNRQARQAAEYGFPYHWLPSVDGDVWSVGRSLDWGFEYLGVLHRVAEMARAARPKSILDVGCGDGRLCGLLLDREEPDSPSIEEIVGVDRDAQAIAFARAFNQRHPRASFEVGAASSVTGTFAVVTLMEVLEHVPAADLEEFVAGLRSAVEPDGSLIVSVPTTNVSLNPKHERHYDLDLLENHLAPWFAVAEVSYVHRTGALADVIRVVTGNRLWTLRWRAGLAFLGRLYRQRVLPATASTGAHLLVRAKPSG